MEGGAGAVGSVGALGNIQTIAAQLAYWMGLVPVVIASVSLLAAVITSLAGATASALPGLLAMAPAMLGLVGVMVAVQIGTQGIDQAFGALAKGDMKAFDQALKNLAPSARAFMLEVKALWPPQLQSLQQQAVQQQLFQGFSDWLKDAAQNLLPTVRRGLVDMAGVANLAGTTILSALSLPATKDDLSTAITNITRGFRAIAGDAGNLVVIFVRIAACRVGAAVYRAPGDRSGAVGLHGQPVTSVQRRVAGEDDQLGHAAV
ncbi:hypothetical protein [Fodinicola feengrottensis]|uniref:hypothetical protein n=1 Tax=Fodinicola feengrottensis TaxID=435914 RepID=UPI0013D0F6C0|nr:hypothetical protein [Fodinicola feengrottensis]